MMTGSNCPAEERLGAFILGRLGHTETEPILRHLERCSDCLHRLHSAPLDDPLLDDCRAGAQIRIPTLPAALLKLIRQIKGLRGVTKP
jgi:hypothetical protein